VTQTAKSSETWSSAPWEQAAHMLAPIQFHLAEGLAPQPGERSAVARVARVCKPGGRLGFTAWKPETGFSPVAEKYRPPPEPEAGDSDDWSREEDVRDLLGEAFELEFEHTEWRFAPEPAETLWERLTFAVGPFKVLVESLDPDERDQFHQEFVSCVDGFGDKGVPGDYVLVLGRSR